MRPRQRNNQTLNEFESVEKVRVHRFVTVRVYRWQLGVLSWSLHRRGWTRDTCSPQRHPRTVVWSWWFPDRRRLGSYQCWTLEQSDRSDIQMKKHRNFIWSAVHAKVYKIFQKINSRIWTKNANDLKKLIMPCLEIGILDEAYSKPAR